jgi:NitT/TauT family transport system permease protein
MGASLGLTERSERSRGAIGALLRRPGLIRPVSVVVTLIVWEVYGRSVSPIFFSYPTAVAGAVPLMVGNGELPRAVGQSLHPLAVGFGMAIISGVLVGLVTGRYRKIDALTDVQLTALYSTPNVALIPLMILWFGLGFEAKVAVVWLSAFFPIVMNTHGGVRTVSRSLLDIGRVERATEAQLMTKIVVPASLPFIMTGIRLSVGRAVVGIVVAEMFTAITGLGGRIIFYANQFRMDKLLVVIIVLAMLGVLLTQAARLLENRFAPWRETDRA